MNSLFPYNSEIVTFQGVINCNSSFWQVKDFSNKWELIHAFHMKKKCERELDLSKSEMLNFLDFYHSKQQLIEEEISYREANLQDRYTVGVVHLLKQLLLHVNYQLSNGIMSFSEYVNIPDYIKGPSSGMNDNVYTAGWGQDTDSESSCDDNDDF